MQWFKPRPVSEGWLCRFVLQAACLLSTLVPLAHASASECLGHSVAAAGLAPLAPGITFPVRLGRTLRAGRIAIGTKFVVKTTQRVAITRDTYLNRGAKLEGTIVASTAGDGSASSPAVLSVRFTTLGYKKMATAVTLSAIAIANFVEVGDTFLPARGGADRGDASESSWTTTQIGGDEVVRSGWVGPVVGIGIRTVGCADYYGVYALPDKDNAAPPRALGVFSTTANGLYGFPEDTTLSSSGGVIALTSPSKGLELRDGDNLLLEVVGSQ